MSNELIETLLEKVDLRRWVIESQPEVTPEQRFLTDLSNEDFSANGRVHDWRNHVDEDLCQVWPTLSDETRVEIYMMAKREADNEEWD